jgi:hypothetical protein
MSLKAQRERFLAISLKISEMVTYVFYDAVVFVRADDLICVPLYIVDGIGDGYGPR